MSQKPRVLVVDDSAVIRDLIRVNLELEGYEVVEAVDGRSCLDSGARGTRRDVITLDALMPRCDGWWTAEIRADPRLDDIPIVMVTASVQQADRARSRGRRRRASSPSRSTRTSWSAWSSRWPTCFVAPA